MRRALALVLILSGCAAHEVPGEPEQSSELRPAFEADPEAAELEAACRAAGPSLTNVLLAKAASAEPHVDAIAHRITQSCIERGRLDEARCMMDASTLPSARACAPDWALPWLGVAGCDAYMHDVVCVLDELGSPDPDVADAMYQVFDAWLSVPLEELPEGVLNDACEMAVDTLMQQPMASGCADGRASRASPD